MADNKSSGKFNNHVTRFSKFTWGDDTKLRDAIQKVRNELKGEPLPKRFKVKL